jgi:IS1 family transposase
LKNSKIDVDPIPRGNSYEPKAVLEVWIFIRIARRINGTIHCSYIPATKSYGKRYMSMLENSELDKWQSYQTFLLGGGGSQGFSV